MAHVPVAPAVARPRSIGGRLNSVHSIKKLYGDMQITVSRDPRQMTDWLSADNFSLCIRCDAGSEVGKAMQHKLPIGYLDADYWKEVSPGSAPRPGRLRDFNSAVEDRHALGERSSHERWSGLAITQSEAWKGTRKRDA